MKRLIQVIKMTADIRSMLTTQNVHPKDQGDVIALAIAKHLAYCCPVPTSEVENYRQYFLENYNQVCAEVISQINEQMVLDVEMVRDCTYRIWSLRYEVVYLPHKVDLEELMDLASEGKFSPDMDDDDVVKLAKRVGTIIEAHVDHSS